MRKWNEILGCGSGRRTAPGGYLLVETIVAMAVLSVSMLGIHRVLDQSILVRGQSQDFSTARLLLEQVAAKYEVQPEVVVGFGQGVFPAPYSRFSFDWRISKHVIPGPRLPGGLNSEERRWVKENFTPYIGKLAVRITWTRGGSVYSAVGETLLRPGQLWQRPPNR